MVGNVVFYLSSQPWWRVTHQKLYFGTKTVVDDERERTFSCFIYLVLIYLVLFGDMYLGIPDNFGHFAGIGEKEREIGAVYDNLAFVTRRDIPPCHDKPWRLYQNILFLVFGCWRAGEK